MGVVIAYVLFMVLMWLMTAYISQFNKKNKNENHKNISKKARSQAHGVIFGKEKITSNNVVFSQENEAGHVLIVGGTGSGKTTAGIIPVINSMSQDTCCFCIDVAGDISNHVKSVNKKIFDLHSQETSNFNFFSEIDITDNLQEKETLLLELASLIVVVDERSSDVERYYNQSAQTILKSAFLAFYEDFKDKDDYCTLFDFIAQKSWKQLFKEIDKSNSETAKKLISSFANNDKLNAESYATLLREIEMFVCDPVLRPHLRRNEAISAQDINNKQIYVVIREHEVTKYAPLLKLMTAQVLQNIRKRENLVNKNTLMVLDELSAYGFGIKELLLDALQRSRKKNVRIMMAVQSLSDLHKVFNDNDDVQSALNNCDFTMIMSCNSVADAEACQKLIGEHTSYTKSYTKSASSTSVTHSERQDNAVSVTELRALKADKKLILVHEKGFCRLYKNFYFENC